ncbi:hypothetical protein MC885_009232 [Smutsia gigantea]|nr:hypothetical protein MC885_009232 [Smutsia gigantea]
MQCSFCRSLAALCALLAPAMFTHPCPAKVFPAACSSHLAILAAAASLLLLLQQRGQLVGTPCAGLQQQPRVDHGPSSSAAVTRGTWCHCLFRQPLQNGISPRMFKAFVSKSHPEFSSNRQQDAQEFFLHLVNLVERNRIGSENPSDVFRFLVEERIQCCQTRKVRYTERVDYLMQLPVAMEAASNKDELIAYELTRREAEANRRPLPEVVRAKIPFSACLQAFSEPENIKKFTFGLDWVPKKFDVSVDMPDLLDINHLRARGLQPGEEELPDISPPIVIPDDSKDRLMNQLIDPSDIDESSVMQLAEMGFPLEACRKAVYFTGNMGAEVAFNWIIVHMEEPDFAEPLTMPGYGGVTSAGASVFGAMGLDNQPPEEIVAIITSMGFHRNQAIQALRATNNNLERALDWIFSHPEFEEDSDFVIEMENNANANIISEAKPEGPRVKDGSGMYELWVIYNDHKVCASERPPKDLGYMHPLLFTVKGFPRFQVESSQEDIQVPEISRLEKFRLVHQGKCDSEGSPDIPRDCGMRNLLLIPALSLQTEGSEKIANCLSRRVEKQTFKNATNFRVKLENKTED